jgi:hypothetical protein
MKHFILISFVLAFIIFFTFVIGTILFVIDELKNYFR